MKPKTYKIELTRAEYLMACNALNKTANGFDELIKGRRGQVVSEQTIGIWRQSAEDHRALTRNIMEQTGGIDE